MTDSALIALNPFTIGTRLSETSHGPISRTTLALFAGASNDHVRLHIDSDFAKAAGMEDVFAHGMLTMAYLAQALEAWASQERLRAWNVRFTAIVPLHAMVLCRAEVIDVFEHKGERRARLKVGAWTDRETQVIDGEALVAIE